MWKLTLYKKADIDRPACFRGPTKEQTLKNFQEWMDAGSASVVGLLIHTWTSEAKLPQGYVFNYFPESGMWYIWDDLIMEGDIMAWCEARDTFIELAEKYGKWEEE